MRRYHNIQRGTLTEQLFALTCEYKHQLHKLLTISRFLHLANADFLLYALLNPLFFRERSIQLHVR